MAQMAEEICGPSAIRGAATHLYLEAELSNMAGDRGLTPEDLTGEIREAEAVKSSA